MLSSMKGLLLLKARAILGGFIGVVFAALAWSGVLDTVEDLTVDYRLRLRKSQKVSEDVRLVGIGDRDVGSTLGGWPFARAMHGDVLRILNYAKARHVAFDILFTEPSADVTQDAHLKAVIEELPNVTLAYHFETAEPDKHEPPAEDHAHFLTGASRFGLHVNELVLVQGRLPVAPFAKLPVGYGAVNFVPDSDGSIRRVPLFFAHEGRLYPSLAMQTVIDALKLHDDQISIVPGKEVTLVDTPRGTLHIPIDVHGQYRINFLGDVGVFTPAFQYLDLRRGVETEEDARQLEEGIKDRIVLVGLVSTGNTDMVRSSIGRIPGVAVQATVVSNILSGSHLYFPPGWLQALLIVASGTSLGICMLPVRPWFGIGVFVLGLACWCGGAVLAANADVILPVVPVLGTFSVAALGMLGMEAAVLKQDRSRVVNVLGRYIARPLLERLIDVNHQAASPTERRELTIFFSDIRGFTAWTERAEPDEVATRLNEYFAAMTPLVERHGGTLDKFIGDCIMVFFGAPVVAKVEDQALSAVHMALDMQREMNGLAEKWARRGYEPLRIGIGIHTGYVTVGSFGSSTFLDYTVIGRAVNLAARIESQTEGGKILISASTQALVREHIQTRPHPALVLKGIPEPQVVFEVVI
jgi:adenylate cyclase